jgi:hypothetical protein
MDFRWGSEPRFDSIPIKNLRPLLGQIESDFNSWIKEDKPQYKKRYDGDSAEGKEVAWDGFSGPIQYFFKTKEINPSEKYSHLYASRRHTIAVSYVWSITSLSTIAGALQHFNDSCNLDFSNLQLEHDQCAFPKPRFIQMNSTRRSIR